MKFGAYEAVFHSIGSHIRFIAAYMIFFLTCLRQKYREAYLQDHRYGTATSVQDWKTKCGGVCWTSSNIPHHTERHTHIIKVMLPHHHDWLSRILNSMIFFFKLSDFNEALTNSLMMIY